MENTHIMNASFVILRTDLAVCSFPYCWRIL